MIKFAPFAVAIAVAIYSTLRTPAAQCALDTDAHVPSTTDCPSTALIRIADSCLNPGETAYISARKAKADRALWNWISRQGNFAPSKLPVVALASSGGGLRALLNAAGVVQAFDGRDSDGTVSGLYQALSYESGLSGSALFLSSLVGHNWPTVSFLCESVWTESFSNDLLLPKNMLSRDIGVYQAIAADARAKEHRGFTTSMTDSFGRALSYQLLTGSPGGVHSQLTSVRSLSNFTEHNVPYPIITALGVEPLPGKCFPDSPPIQYEFHPYEYGSWDNGVSAFADTAYMGTRLEDGQPKNSSRCVQKYDELGFIMATSANVWNALCAPIGHSNRSTPGMLAGILPHSTIFEDIFAHYPNPFYHLADSPRVSAKPLLHMVDGGWANQNNPIWPLIQPSRDVGVLFVNDNSDDTTDLFPNGTDIHQTYLNAKTTGLGKMPRIPNAEEFVAHGLNKRAVFFGCPALQNSPHYVAANDENVILVVYLPNVDYQFASNQPTYKFEYSPVETTGMIANGHLVAEQNGASDWGLCLACAIMKGKVGNELSELCGKCFDKWCY